MKPSYSYNYKICICGILYTYRSIKTVLKYSDLGKTSHIFNLAIQPVHVHRLATYNRYLLYRCSTRKKNTVSIQTEFSKGKLL